MFTFPLSRRKKGCLLSFYDGDTLCGFVYLATIGKQTFIMFFAVDKNIRSKGYESGILDKIQQRYPNNKIIVSIEPCDKSAESFEQKGFIFTMAIKTPDII